ncbi:MAG: response regulator [Acidobacteriia bacterium]|nr:response regulator [Terriglobia bacterium]
MNSQPRILIVDDEGAIRGLLTAAFSMAGYHVRTAAVASEAMRLCADEPFDIVLSDVVMPEMDGHELARWIANRHPHIRTVLMSGFDSGCHECPLAGRCMLLPKPFRPSEAVSVVARALADPPATPPSTLRNSTA